MYVIYGIVVAFFYITAMALLTGCSSNAERTIGPSPRPHAKVQPSIEHAISGDPATVVSAYRRQNSLGPVSSDPTLSALAQQQSTAMARQEELSHKADGEFMDRISRAGVRRAVENIAYGSKTFDGTMTQWINSPGHRANLLYPGATRIGVGSAVGASGRTYWTLILGS